jgi:hypothetical protein
MINIILNMLNVSKHELNIISSFYAHLIKLSSQFNIKGDKINTALSVCADINFSHCYSSALLTQNTNLYCRFQTEIILITLYSVTG